MIKNHYKKLLLPIAISALTACGGGGGGSSSSDSGSSGGGSSVAVSGTPSKGIILGGTVSAYLITANGEKGTQVGDAVTTSTTDGSYSLSLPSDYDGSPLLIEVTATDGTLMRCDLAVCDSTSTPQVVFGDDYSLPNTFVLTATIPGTTDSAVTVNVTPLTSLAANLALDKIAKGAAAADATLASNAQVMDLFGLSGDLTSQAIVDITNPTAVNGASADALEYNLRAAAVAQASQGLAGELTAALNVLIQQMVESGIADTDGGTDDPSVVTLEEILEQAQALVNEIENKASDDGVELDNDITTVTSTISSEAASKANGSTTPTQGEVPADIGSEGLQASKAFVAQLRDLTNVASQTEASLTPFSDQLDLAGQAVSGDTKLVTDALGQAAAAIAYAFEAHQEDDTLTSFESDGVNVSISGNTYTVDQDISVDDASTVAVNLTATAALENGIDGDEVVTDTNTLYREEETESGVASVDLAIAGSASTSNVSLTVAEGSQLVATLEVDYARDDQWSQSGFEGSVRDNFSLTDLDITLLAELAQQQTNEVIDPVTFAGSISLKIDFLDSQYADNIAEGYTDTSYDYADDYTESIQIDGLELTLSGTFANSSTELTASASLAADNYLENCSGFYNESYIFSTGYFENSWDDQCQIDETEQDFATVSLTVTFSADLQGINDDVTVVANATRTGLEAASVTIDLSYGGSSLDFAFEGELENTDSSTITVTNHNNVVLTLTETYDDLGGSELSGNIQQDNEKFADVDEDAGVPVITYIDGTFETL